MRLWTLHPQYLDAQGLVALWREALLAVLAGALYLGLLFAVKILGPDDLRILRSFLRTPARSPDRA